MKKLSLLALSAAFLSVAAVPAAAPDLDEAPLGVATSPPECAANAAGASQDMYCPGIIQLETYLSVNGDVVYVTITCTLEEEIYIAEDMIFEHETGTYEVTAGTLLCDYGRCGLYIRLEGGTPI